MIRGLHGRLRLIVDGWTQFVLLDVRGGVAAQPHQIRNCCHYCAINQTGDGFCGIMKNLDGGEKGRRKMTPPPPPTRTDGCLLSEHRPNYKK
ncbi:hypothetical protein MTP99_000317 [Tenebrio molitor]|nr:hypothetical protein MTP99_000317 [Tenebrio molitor]